MPINIITKKDMSEQGVYTTSIYTLSLKIPVWRRLFLFLFQFPFLTFNISTLRKKLLRNFFF